MSVTAPKADRDRTRPMTAHFDGDGSSQTLRILRTYLSDVGLCESRSAADDGFYFALERAREITIYYNGVPERREAALLQCCHALAQRGFAMTLFLSARNSALFVRDDG